MSALHQAAEDYLAIRRSLGVKLVAEGYLLASFAGYAERRGARQLTTDLALDWATLPAGKDPVLVRQKTGRGARLRPPPAHPRPRHGGSPGPPAAAADPAGDAVPLHQPGDRPAHGRGPRPALAPGCRHLRDIGRAARDHRPAQRRIPGPHRRLRRADRRRLLAARAARQAPHRPLHPAAPPAQRPPRHLARRTARQPAHPPTRSPSTASGSARAASTGPSPKPRRPPGSATSAPTGSGTRWPPRPSTGA